jgi:hypothetical protein
MNQIELRTFLKFWSVNHEQLLMIFRMLWIHLEISLSKLSESERIFFYFSD